MPLPNIVSVALAYAQLVALSPMLIMYDNSEVEIMNTDIPDYGGQFAFLGQSLALALVAVASVKRIFSVNESIKKREIVQLEQEANFYWQLAEKLDRQQCILAFICSLSFRDRNNHCLTPEQKILLSPFGRLPQPSLSTNHSTALTKLHQAAILGQTDDANATTCRRTYSRCRYSMDLMARTLLWIETLTPRDLRNITIFLKRLIVDRLKGNTILKDKIKTPWLPPFLSEIKTNHTQSRSNVEINVVKI